MWLNIYDFFKDFTLQILNDLISDSFLLYFAGSGHNSHDLVEI